MPTPADLAQMGLRRLIKLRDYAPALFTQRNSENPSLGNKEVDSTPGESAPFETMVILSQAA